MAAGDIKIEGQKAKKGQRMTKGASWRLVAMKGQKRIFNATLLDTYSVGTERLAIFRVPKA